MGKKKKKESTFNQFKYQNEWARTKKQTITFKFDKEQDKDILEKLRQQPNQTDYIRNLILKDIQ